MFKLKIGKEQAVYNDGAVKHLWFCQMFRLGRSSGSFIFGTHHHDYLVVAIAKTLSFRNIKRATVRSMREMFICHS